MSTRPWMYFLQAPSVISGSITINFLLPAESVNLVGMTNSRYSDAMRRP